MVLRTQTAAVACGAIALLLTGLVFVAAAFGANVEDHLNDRTAVGASLAVAAFLTGPLAVFAGLASTVLAAVIAARRRDEQALTVVAAALNALAAGAWATLFALVLP